MCRAAAAPRLARRAASSSGGGFGSWSKKFGTGAAGLVEAEVVTADGQVRIANSCQNQDLFWALRGGGGGTFGVVTRVTLRTHPLPKMFGFVGGRIQAANDAAFRELLERFVDFYARSLENEHWGEQVTVKGDNSLTVSMLSEGLTGAEMESVVGAPARFFCKLIPIASPSS